MAELDMPLTQEDYAKEALKIQQRNMQNQLGMQNEAGYLAQMLPSAKLQQHAAQPAYIHSPLVEQVVFGNRIYLVVGTKLYSHCALCGCLVQYNKPLLGSLHICK